MAVPLTIAEPEAFDLGLSFAPYPIHTEVVGQERSLVLVLRDTTTGIEVRANPTTVAAIASDLPAGIVLES